MAEEIGPDSTERRNHDWQITLFGGLRILKNGKPVALPPYRTYNLLATLLLREKLPISRERLGGMLYGGDMPEEKVRGRISDHVWLLRKHLPEFPLISTSDFIDLDKRTIWLDVQAFREEINRTDAPLSETFIELYQGELLPELYDEWILVERERWRSHYLRSLRALVDNLLVAKNYKHAISRIERLLRDEPYDEAAVRLLMQGYLRVGRRGAALAAYEKFRLFSINQFGLEPDKSTLRLYETIRSETTTPRRIVLGDASGPIDFDKILQRAQIALERGERDELQGLLAALPPDLPLEQLRKRQLLRVDEKFLWGEFDQIEVILNDITDSDPAVLIRKARFALVRQNHQLAHDLAEQALHDAHRKKMYALEAQALIILGLAVANLGEKEDALLILDRAIHIAEKHSAHVVLVLALTQRGQLRSLQGSGVSAKETLSQAEKIARQHKLKPLLASALNALGTNANYYGDYQGALKYLLESLELSRDLNLSMLEATVSLILSGTYDFLGRFVETTEAIRNASRISRERQDDFGMAKCYYNLALSIPTVNEDNIEEAVNYAERALEIFVAYKSLGWQASTLTAFGYCQWLAGQGEPALQNFDAAIALYTQLGEQRFIPENYAYIGLVYIDLGNPLKALEYTQFAIQELTRRNLSDIAAEIYYAHASALRALGRTKEAALYVELGYGILQETAQSIEDENARVAYFQRDPITRRLMQLAYDYGIAPKPKQALVTHKLPGSGHYEIKMNITMDTGAADQALKKAKGSTALRRARLKRILEKGNIHGGRLSVQELAGLFKVSSRTIHRDLKYIETL